VSGAISLAPMQRGILDALPAHVALLDGAGTIVAANETWRRFGRENLLQSADACVGLSYLDVCDRAAGASSQEAREVAAGIRAVLRGERPGFSIEYPCHAPDRERWFRLQVTPLEAGSGAVVMHTDISGERRIDAERCDLLDRERDARRRADEAGRYYRALFESAPGCMAVITPDDFTFVAASEAYLASTKTTRAQITGRRLFDVFPDDPADASADGDRNLRASLERVKATRKTDVMAVQRYPIPRPAEEGGGFEERFWSCVCCPVLGPDGSLAHIIIRVEDVTEYIRLRRESGDPIDLGAVLASRERRLEADIVLRSVELQRANERQAQDQALLRIAGRAAKLGGWLYSIPDRKTTWSEETIAIHEEEVGFSPSVEKGIGYYAPEHRDLIRRAFEACVREGAPFDLEARIITAKGRHAWVRAIGVAVRDAAGAITHVQGAFQDITERKAADEQSRENEVRFRLLAKATNDAVWDWNLATNALWWNEGFTAVFGFAAGEIEPTSESWTSRLHPDDRTAVIASVQQAIDGDAQVWSGEYRFLRKDGGFAYVLDRGYIIRDNAGKGVRMIGGMTDLTERRRAEERLREQATLLDSAQDAIMVRDLEHRILFWNRSAERIYGWSPDEARGRSVKDLLYRDATAIKAATAATLARGEWVGELEHTTKDRRSILVESRWTLVRDDRGEPRSILTINTDITQRKLLEAQVLRAQRMESIGTLAGGIAHDLNNVLAPILMIIAMLREDERDATRLADLEGIETCARRGADMVRQLLTFARGDDGRKARIDLGEVAAEVQKIVRDTFPKDISLRLSVARDRWVVIADPTQMHQLFTNLCVNARDAMPHGGSLTIAIENALLDEVFAGMSLDAKPGPYVLIRVEDTGSGIPPAILDRIFEPFFTTKEVGKGTGLGLSTAHAIVRNHGGFIQVKSELGAGTRFKVYLPAVVSDSESEKVAGERSVLPRGDGELILVVDDEESIRNVARRTLERFRYRVLVASNGAEAVGIYAQHRGEIAVVLTDMSMPVMDGPAMIVALRSMNPKVRIIGSSGFSANGNVAKAGGAGVEHFVPKPYTADTLLKVLRTVLAEAR